MKSRKNVKFLWAMLTNLTCVMLVFLINEFEVNAEGKTRVITTTQECSIWTQPNTSEEYRQKKIPAGHQVTIFSDVVQSTKGDGKTFYKTKKGAYILCRCCNQKEENEQQLTNSVIYDYYEQLNKYSQFSYSCAENRNGSTGTYNFCNTQNGQTEFMDFVQRYGLYDVVFEQDNYVRQERNAPDGTKSYYIENVSSSVKKIITPLYAGKSGRFVECGIGIEIIVNGYTYRFNATDWVD